ncbi:LCP family protein [Clavibacter nebraskensis]|uniref:LCP family protein n=3 Tax=Clavibacter nebraskensis TaxID=31963 RepID=A0ABY4MQK8_9MICO|nr:LCP family protein [Clavibacter nebraskensis]KXU21676.1 LytR family transcriptional regulator [Clavibacter nebraskensis]OAH22525.1 LytR family transcriptional regulator [Clavibacter nebraskensis]QGV65819.1 LCP family protein [Clavibacter nebraskensis]QGV68614.1 LCP family protein [Clavibacter nebraskensis]QGV71405.1 LCP family protein [Clavibacter nebraskensis]
MPRETRHDGRLAPGIARHGRLRKPSAVPTAVKALAAATAVVIASTGSVAAFAAWDLARTVQANSVDINDGQAPPPSIGGIDGGANILLAGSDSREGQGDRYGDPAEMVGNDHNDVTMLLHISEDHSRATVVSFPRDLLVDRPACRSADGTRDLPAASRSPFNDSMQVGGLACVVRTVESLTGLAVPYGGVVQFLGVKGITQAIGGVPVCLANPIDDDDADIHLGAGERTLQGDDVVGFLRTRHGVSDGSDIGRISNQQVFLGALARAVTSTGTLTNPAKVYGIARAVVEDMKLSTSLDDPATIASLALTLKDIPLDRITFVQYPGFREGQKVVPDAASADRMMALISADADFALAPDRAANGVVLPPGSEATPDPSSTSDAGAAPSTDPSAPAVLPENVMGQTADEATCSNAR